MDDRVQFKGIFTAECYRQGKLRWRDRFPNTVVTVGRNLALDTILAGAAYTVTGPYIGLISSVGFSAIDASDTMASHAGWTEAGGANAPTYSAPRITTTWSAAAAGAKALLTPASFSITGTGTLKGAFIVFGPGASATIDNTGGTLWSAGLFASGDRPVANGDVLNVNYSVATT